MLARNEVHGQDPGGGIAIMDTRHRNLVVLRKHGSGCTQGFSLKLIVRLLPEHAA